MKEAMILAAGLGTRLKSITDKTPKALVPFLGLPMIEHTINKLKDYGYKRIIVNVHHHREQLIEYLSSNNFGIDIIISDEKEEHLLTGGGIKNAAKYFESDNILIHNVDIISSLDLDLLEKNHNKHNRDVTLAIRKKDDNRVLLFDENIFLSGWKNKLENIEIISRENNFNEEFGFTGIYFVTKKFIHNFPDTNKFDIVQFLLTYSRHHEVKGFIDNSEFWFDLGTKEQIYNAENYFNYEKK